MESPDECAFVRPGLPPEIYVGGHIFIPLRSLGAGGCHAERSEASASASE